MRLDYSEDDILPEHWWSSMDPQQVAARIARPPCRHAPAVVARPLLGLGIARRDTSPSLPVTDLCRGSRGWEYRRLEQDFWGRGRAPVATRSHEAVH